MAKPTTHAEYLAALPADQRAALEALSARITARLAPDGGGTPCISYAMPAWRIASSHGRKNDGTQKVIAGMAAFSRHLGFYPFSGGIIPRLAPRLDTAGFKHSKSGVLFTPDRPLPDWLLDEALALRRAEIG